MTSEPDARIRRPGLFYTTGRTAFFALEADPRFSYCLYVPSAAHGTDTRMPLVVIQHGTLRNAAEYRDVYVAAAEERGWLLLAPLFPVMPNRTDGYYNFHRLVHEGVRYDEVLLAMVDEVARRHAVDGSRFALHGFSGGGQLAHRFFYARPDRLAALSVGAPGHVTLLDDGHDWWAGTADFVQIFGREVDLRAMSDVPVQLVAGAEDTETWELDGLPDGPWHENATEIGHTRIARLQALQHNWAVHGIESRLDLVPGLAHEGLRMGPTVIEFFDEILR